MNEASHPREFSPVVGGPLYTLWLRARLASPPLALVRRRILAIVAVTWLPPALLAVLTGRFAFLFDLTNLQFVTTLPLLLWAEPVVHRRVVQLVPEFFDRDLVREEDRPRFDGIVVRVVRLRDSPFAEAGLALCAFALGYVDRSPRLTEPGWWLAFVSLPISRFILLRWYFRLFVWYVFLWRVSRLRIRLNPLHVDRAGGLGFLGGSATAFAPLLVAQSSFVAMVIGNRIWHSGARLSDFREALVAVLVILTLSVIAPLTFFAKQMYEARFAGLIRYGRLASRYTDLFQRKWLDTREGQEDALLGTSDIQCLSDLANSYDVVRAMRLAPFDKLVVLRLAVVAALPLLLLAFANLRVDELLAALVKLVL